MNEYNNANCAYRLPCGLCMMTNKQCPYDSNNYDITCQATSFVTPSMAIAEAIRHATEEKEEQNND